MSRQENWRLTTLANLQSAILSSQLFLAVFDMDAQSSHDFVGRVSVDISNLRPSLTYLLQYNLHRVSPILSQVLLSLRSN